jgi:signal transduction histidine kinase
MKSIPLVPKLACESATVCPINQGPCPGHCVFADVLSSVRLGIVIFDLRREALTFVNGSARALLERHGFAIDHRTLRALLVPAGVDPGALAEPLSPDPLTIDGRILGYTLYAARDHAWVFVRDVTEKLRLESIAESVELMNSLGFVFSAVRHELGNPINSLKAALTVLRRGLDRLGRDAIEAYVDRMLDEVKRVEHLLRGMKSFSMFERVEPSAIALAEFLSDFQRLVTEDADRRAIALRVACPTGLRVRADARALSQALLNLFANATEALDGIEQGEIAIDAAADDAIVRIRIADNGRGLPSDGESVLFKPFYTSKEHGTGLGLVITRKLLAKMEGTVSLERRSPRGVVATILLPVVASAAE